MEVHFNSTMFTAFNLTELNDTWVDMYVQPYELDSEAQDLTHLNFTWEAIFYEEDVMKIKIDWNDYSSISTDLV